MQKLLLALFFFLAFHSFSQDGLIVLTEDRISSSYSKDVLYIEDADKSLTLDEVLKMDASKFSRFKDNIPNMDFTTSRFWLRFKIKNNTDQSYFILETGRPISNKVNFYQLRGGQIENQFKSGDDYHYSEKVIPHRKNLFPVSIEPGETKEYVIEAESDGETIIFPVKIHDKIGFFAQDYKHQFSFGFYYGLMSLVIIIYFFFFILLKDNAFLYYILYVFAQALLQFSLDGFSFHHFFPSGGYMANHFILIIAGVTVIVLLKYVDLFLNLKDNHRPLLKIFRFFQFLVGASVIVSLIPGKTYEIAYPVINGVSLVSIILSVVAIYVLRAKRIKVDIYFTIAFTILIIGAIIFILGNFSIVGDAEMAQFALKLSSAFEVSILSISMSNKYRKLQKDKEEAQALALKSLEEQNELMENLNIKLESQVKERTAEIEKQKEELAEINEEILSSIHYAKRIQEAILPSSKHVKSILPDSFIMYRPKDVVSGDFYFVEQTTTSDDLRKLAIIAAVDCTGHGVPGAFMSIVGNNQLGSSLTEPSVNDTAAALDYLNKGVVNSLRQNKDADQTVRDGMDIALCAIDWNNLKVQFSGAKNPIYVIRKGASESSFKVSEGADVSFLESENKEHMLMEVKGDSHPIGAYIGEELKPFTARTIEIEKGDMIYIFSDGYADQFGGPNGKKYKYKTFKNFLLSIAHLDADEQKSRLITEYEEWKGNYEQIDDVLVMGVRVG
ncbi:MAG: SpoIIE family protein phosphatase [Crocinitomicaceae bacterium]|nr:SpoIIE family protein phosphatase [Crocinitomicaceae bacterium]